MNVGEKLFCFDTKTKNIFEATFVGSFVSTTGYELYAVLNSKGEKKSLELVHCHKTKEAAEAHKDRILPMMAEGDKIAKEAEKKIDEIRIKIIGEPVHLELAQKIMGLPPKKGGK